MQAIVCKTISEAFPKDGIIAEESADVLRESSSSDLLAKVVAAVSTAAPGPASVSLTSIRTITKMNNHALNSHTSETCSVS